MSDENMPLTFGTVACVIKHCDAILDELSTGNEVQFIRKLLVLGGNGADAADNRRKLMASLDGLRVNLRVLKLSTIGGGE